VDCFAGPWESTGTDYIDTSFGRAVQIIRGCQKKLETSFGKTPEFRALFIEKEADAYAKLKAFADQACGPRLKVEAWHGEFQGKVDAIASWIGTDFAFVLIDPKGYKKVISPETLAPLLKKRNVEALINYMWQFLSLAVGHLDKPAHRQNLIAVFGDDVCNAPPAGSPNRESWLLDLYRQRLALASQTVGEGRTRTVSFPIEYPGRTTTKYILILVTHNDVGVIKFAEASSEASATQSSVRFRVVQQRRESKTGTGDLFADAEIDSLSNDVELSEPWLELLPDVGSEVRVGEPEMAKLIERNNCLMPPLQKGLLALIKSGHIENLDMTRARPKNGVLYKKNERLKRLK
jgi:three-Cys-motif partner protein